jgi:trimethylamine--corrinoid protein Co-methyltransferase
MRLHSPYLATDEVERVHEASLRILAETGVRVHGELGLPLLEDAGARVDRETGIATIPRSLVEAALARTPRQWTLGARNPALDFALPSARSAYAIDGTAAFMQDVATGERRYGRKSDITDAMRVLRACDLAVMAWPPVAASDAPVGSRPLHEFAAMLAAYSGHGEHELHTRAQAPFLAAIIAAFAGSEAAARERHEASLVYCPVAPLVHDGPMLDGYLDMGGLDVPVMVLPMPVPGTTGPASLLGNIALANAEALSAIVLFEAAHPGRPLIYGSAVGSMDFRSGGFLAGTPEMAIQSAALTTMGKFYGLPTAAAGSASDAHEAGPEACIEKLLSIIPCAASGADVIIGFGEIDGDQTLVLEQILVDNELAHLAERLVAGVDARDGAELLDDVAEVGPGGHFLAQPASRRAARSGEFYEPALIGRNTLDGWVAAGRPSMYSRAREQVAAILAGPVVDPVPEAVLDEVDRILAEADRALGAG